jgi:hypothetical protein
VNTTSVSSWLVFKVACSKPLVSCHQNSLDGLLTSVAKEDLHRRSLTKYEYFARERTFFQNFPISLDKDLWYEILASPVS